MPAATLDNFAGRLIRPGDAEYDAARIVWNAMADKRPALIARCAGADDVVAALRFAREHELVVAVRGGGHSVAGIGARDRGLVIEPSWIPWLTVDCERKGSPFERGAPPFQPEPQGPTPGASLP